jgi:hypothetical protein
MRTASNKNMWEGREQKFLYEQHIKVEMSIGNLSEDG